MKYIAHRGYSRKATENSIESATLAGMSEYFYGIEYDIHLTKDNKFVVHHDFTTERLSELNLTIKDSTYEELSRVKLINKNTNEYNVRIPLLDEYINICNNHDKVNVIEIKPIFNDEEINLFLNEIKKANNVIVISFNLNNLLKIRKLNSDIKLQYLTGEFNKDNFEICKDNNIDLDLQYQLITKDNMEYFKENNFIVNCWTVNNNELANEVINLKVDFITTDGLLEYK